VAHHPHRLLVTGLTLALAATACSHHKKDPGALPTADVTPSVTASVPSGSASASASGTSSSPGSSGSATTPASSASGVPATSARASHPGSSSASPDNRMTVTITLAHPCVTAGGEQTAEITALPGSILVIDTVYADGKEGQTHGGLNSNARTDSKGHLTYSWTVLPGTPAGKATTYTAATHERKQGNASASFEVKTVC
jgi:hypothetical protein